MKVAFFDRDGTIIEGYPDHEWTRIEHPVCIEGSINSLKIYFIALFYFLNHLT